MQPSFTPSVRADTTRNHRQGFFEEPWRGRLEARPCTRTMFLEKLGILVMDDRAAIVDRRLADVLKRLGRQPSLRRSRGGRTSGPDAGSHVLRGAPTRETRDEMTIPRSSAVGPAATIDAMARAGSGERIAEHLARKGVEWLRAPEIAGRGGVAAVRTAVPGFVLSRECLSSAEHEVHATTAAATAGLADRQIGKAVAVEVPDSGDVAAEFRIGFA